MIINCTKKLCDELKINPQKVEIVDPLFSWHANIIRVNRKKTVVLVNDSNRYTIVLYRITSYNVCYTKLLRIIKFLI